MRAFGRTMILAAVLAAALQCNLALDFDSLQSSGPEDTGEPVEERCSVDADCNDGFDCTDDVCGPDGSCTNTPDNDKCDKYEMCKRGEGCVDSGRECVVNEECDDGVDCTTDRCADGVCNSWPDDDWCTEFDVCWIGSTCDSEEGCVGGYEKQCNQPAGASCYLVVCNPETGLCDSEELKAGADSDNDGYCDASEMFGGDDCNDGDPTVNPSREDICNVVDDNCDGVPDGLALDGPLDVVTGDNLLSPSVAFDGVRFAVAWQEGFGAEATVRLQVLGTGACLVDAVCDVDDGSLPAISPVDHTAMGGAGAAGSEPALAAFGGRFALVWRSETAGEPPRIMAVELAVDGDSSEIVFDGDAAALSDGSSLDVSAPRIDWKDDDGWVAVWLAELSDGTHAIQAATMSGAVFTGDAVDVPIRDLALSCFDGADCMAAYAREETGDSEVFEARLEILGSSIDYRTGWPKLVSVASEAADASRNPAIAWTGADAWVTSFTDVAVADINIGPEPESDIRAAVDGEIRSLVAEDVAHQYNAGLAFDQERFGALYTADMDGALSLDFRLMTDELGLYDRQLTRLGEMGSGAFVAAPVLFTGQGFAIAWVEKPALTVNRLRFVHFEGCAQPSN